ncbi:hypothetical protein [Ornithinimicrobium faecis]|uniref:hypothetical protein n=1 Tax=Ornithinimicrobium faecis TaxID=2934158 RepID=UPI00211764EC|nr:hypothetical protein [Ornithinimicrobium sp. HY1745]
MEASISVVSLTELHLGVLLATEPDELARRTERLAVVEATFDPLPVALVESVPLLTHNVADFAIIEHLVDVRRPQAQGPQSRQAD